jgi:hypothetical protein
MSEETFHVTSEDLRKIESRESKSHGGKTPRDSDVSALKVTLSTISLLATSHPSSTLHVH